MPRGRQIAPPALNEEAPTNRTAVIGHISPSHRRTPDTTISTLATQRRSRRGRSVAMNPNLPRSTASSLEWLEATRLA